MAGPSKRIRFEVFKRDKFTCQYCGSKAPDVVLHVDHVQPRAEGGEDSLLNLVTACADCNLGKGHRALSDDSVVAKQRNQLDVLQERREQLEMMIGWQRSLARLDTQAVDELAAFWHELAPMYVLSDAGLKSLAGLIRKYGAEEVATAMRIAVEIYLKAPADEAEEEYAESWDLAWSKVSGICRTRAASANKPYLMDLYYVRGILRNRAKDASLSYLDERRAVDALEVAFSWGGERDRLVRIAAAARTWTKWMSDMADYIDELLAASGEDA